MDKIKCLEELKIDCESPVQTPTKYVSREMALDAGDLSLEGSIARQGDWERCGSCPNCLFNQMKQEIISDLTAYQELKGRISVEKILNIVMNFWKNPPRQLCEYKEFPDGGFMVKFRKEDLAQAIVSYLGGKE